VISKSNERAARNHKHDFGPELQDMKLNYHSITAILRLLNSVSTNILLIESCQVAGLLKSGHEKAVTSHFVFETEMI